MVFQSVSRYRLNSLGRCKWPGSCEFYGLLSSLYAYYPGPRGILLTLSFFIWNLRRKALIEALSREKRKPLVKIVENVTFMLAQHVTAVKDLIFF